MPGIVRGNGSEYKCFHLFPDGTVRKKREKMMTASPKTSSVGIPTVRQVKGRDGEDQALSFLSRQGLVLVERNFRCRGGEIDLIMREGNKLVFVEVRSRGSGSFGGAASSVTSGKRARLILAAQVFLQQLRSIPACRFDVIAFEGEQISWLKNAIET